MVLPVLIKLLMKCKSALQKTQVSTWHCKAWEHLKTSFIYLFFYPDKLRPTAELWGRKTRRPCFVTHQPASQVSCRTPTLFPNVSITVESWIVLDLFIFCSFCHPTPTHVSAFFGEKQMWLLETLWHSFSNSWCCLLLQNWYDTPYVGM